MKTQPLKQTGKGKHGTLQARYAHVRGVTDAMATGLSDADATVQSMEDASPAKWHLAHVSWFFEEVILKPNDVGYTEFDEKFSFLFNSYYDAVGARQPRPKRGMLTRPSLERVFAYRAYVDEHMDKLLAHNLRTEIRALVEQKRVPGLVL